MIAADGAPPRMAGSPRARRRRRQRRREDVRGVRCHRTGRHRRVARLQRGFVVAPLLHQPSKPVRDGSRLTDQDVPRRHEIVRDETAVGEGRVVSAVVVGHARREVVVPGPERLVPFHGERVAREVLVLPRQHTHCSSSASGRLAAAGLRPAVDEREGHEPVLTKGRDPADEVIRLEDGDDSTNRATVVFAVPRPVPAQRDDMTRSGYRQAPALLRAAHAEPAQEPARAAQLRERVPELSNPGLDPVQVDRSPTPFGTPGRPWSPNGHLRPERSPALSTPSTSSSTTATLTQSAHAMTKVRALSHHAMRGYAFGGGYLLARPRALFVCLEPRRNHADVVNHAMRVPPTARVARDLPGV